jgi:uncharacterized RDD family membrane protein YckC
MDQIVTSPRATTTTSPVAPAMVYAGFWRRVGASILDSLIVSAVTQALSTLAGYTQNDTVISLIAIVSFVLSLAYYIYFIGNKGQTPGKMILRIKVVRLDGVSKVGYGKAFIREVLGKFVSSIAFMFGYFWMIWDKKKQTWHDKMAKTVVVKI